MYILQEWSDRFMENLRKQYKPKFFKNKIMKAQITVTFECILEDGEPLESAVQNYKDSMIEVFSDYAANFIVTGKIINNNLPVLD